MIRGNDNTLVRIVVIAYLQAFMLGGIVLYSGCGRRESNHRGSAALRAGGNLRDLIAATNDEERWAIVTRVYEPVLSASKYSTIEELIKGVVTTPGPDTDMILAHFPSIASRLDLSQADLRRIGSGLDSPDHFMWDERTSTGRVYRISQFSQSTVSRILLRELTGVEFESNEQFTAWLQERRPWEIQKIQKIQGQIPQVGEKDGSRD